MCALAYVHACRVDYLCDDGGQAGVVEAFMVRVGFLVPLPVRQLHLQGFMHPF